MARDYHCPSLTGLRIAQATLEVFMKVIIIVIIIVVVVIIVIIIIVIIMIRGG